MVNKRTVIVVGAGAGFDIGMPLGKGLKDKIAASLNFNFDGVHVKGGSGMFQSILALYSEKNRFDWNQSASLYKTSIQISRGLSQAISIDHFIHSQGNNKKIELIGKLAIIYNILLSESESKLKIEKGRIDLKQVEHTWFNKFFQLITETGTVNDLPKKLENIIFINFNYDRCLEHFLLNSLMNYFNIEKNDAIEILSYLKIYHPYGRIGNLPWMDQNKTVEFGRYNIHKEYLNLVDDIKTFTEGIDPNSSEIINIRKAVHEANMLLFLGFAFHPLNMKLLKPDQRTGENYHCYATAFKESASNCAYFKNEIYKIKNKQPGNVMIENDFDCTQLFTNYWRAFSIENYND